MEKTEWRGQERAFKEAIQYMKLRKEGLITSMKTPWPKMNDATLDGIEWQSMTVIGARPGGGKTSIKDQIIRECFALNTATKMRVLEFSLEMVGKVTAVRAFSARIGKSYKEILSAERSESGHLIRLTDDDLDKCIDYSKVMMNHPVDIVEKSPTVEEFIDIVTRYMDTHATTVASAKTPGKMLKKYVNTVVTIDHSILLTTKKGQSKTDMLYELGSALTLLKRRYPIIFIVLSQLNRAIDHPDRNRNGEYGNYILDSDIFGSDALLQHAESVIGLNRPGKQKISEYGPERFVINSDKILAMHFLKSRNGENGIAWFKTRFEIMKIEEMTKPVSLTNPETQPVVPPKIVTFKDEKI